MNSECLRVADQLKRAFEGEAWHGPDLKQLLADVTAEEAAARPVAGVHSIWELVLHIEVWTGAAAESTKGVPMPKIFNTVEDWPAASEGESRWAEARTKLFATGTRIASAIGDFGDQRLHEIVPGRQYDFYYLFHGIVQHSLYHAGQIALLKKTLRTQA